MAVLPATCRLDLPTFRRITRRKGLLLATEEELRRVFPDCEVGAMPPYGNLYDMPVFADTCFGPKKELVFQAGNHHEVVHISFEDFEKTAQPVMTDFCRR
jgi:Ala-tRNA(Pro) deacylase